MRMIKIAKRWLAAVLALSLCVGCGTTNAPNESVEETVELFDIASYNGTWATDDIGWVYGGLVLDISVLENDVLFDLTNYGSAPFSRIASTSADVLPSEITENSITFHFDEDGWGNSGTVVLTFLENQVCVEVQNLTADPNAMWGFYEGEYFLSPNSTAYDTLYYEMDDYYAMFPEFAPQPEPTPTYDTSRASGILASKGMTEQDFKNSCIPLSRNGAVDKKTTAYYVDEDDLLRYPNNYIGQHFMFARNRYDYFPCEYCTGRDDGCSSTAFLQKYDDNGKHWINRADPTTFVPNAFKLGSYSRGLTTDGYLYYELSDCYIYDYRDDPYSPNLVACGNVASYLIFLGVTSDGKMLRFALIACEEVDW